MVRSMILRYYLYLFTISVICYFSMIFTHIITATLRREEPILYCIEFFEIVRVVERLGARMAFREIMFEGGKPQKIKIFVLFKILLALSYITR